MFDAAASDSEHREHDAPPDEANAGLPVSAESWRAAPPPQEQAELKLLPYYPSHAFASREASPAKPAAARPPRDWRRWRAAASLAAVVAIGGAAAAAHVHSLRVARAEEAQARVLGRRLDSMTARLESIDANRSRDELANMRKVLAEIKASATGTRDVGGAVTQLTARVERLEKDQSARLDKLGDRLDHDGASRLADIAARLEKLEVKMATPTVVAAVAATPAKPAAAAKTAEVAKAEPGVSYETTGAIEKPRPRLRGFRIAEVHNGYAMIQSADGEFAVAPGDFVPGVGRVLRIERHGRDWVVVTTQGQIAAMD